MRLHCLYSVDIFTSHSYPSLLLHFLSCNSSSTSSVSRNCSNHTWSMIHCVILPKFFGLFITLSNVRYLAFLHTSALPLAFKEQANTTCLTFAEGYPHRHLGLSTPSTFLQYRQKLNPICSLLMCVAMLLWALFRFRWSSDGVLLKPILCLLVFLTMNRLAAFHISGSADARRLEHRSCSLMRPIFCPLLEHSDSSPFSYVFLPHPSMCYFSPIYG